ncbi:hypothetical protein MBTS_12430 [Methylobacterium bullatum]|nr:hypothetical protein [Methylobacterium bullatum]
MADDARGSRVSGDASGASPLPAGRGEGRVSPSSGSASRRQPRVRGCVRKSTTRRYPLTLAPASPALIRGHNEVSTILSPPGGERGAPPARSCTNSHGTRPRLRL